MIHRFEFDKSRCMASNPDFIQYIADQCAGAGEIAVKKALLKDAPGTKTIFSYRL